MAESLPYGFAAALLTAPDAGTEDWWGRVAHLGTPLIESADRKQVRVTFLWRDPDGMEALSPTQRVYADINGVTDHHSCSPQSLTRLAGTDVWHWSVLVENDWRGSYCFLPVGAGLLPPAFSEDEDERRRQQREWWYSLSAHAVADPLNANAPHHTWGGQPESSAHMPGAPSQTAWRRVDRGEGTVNGHRLQTFTWRSDKLGNARRIWLYTTGDSSAPEQRPLAIVLDGQRWAEQFPLFSALDEETQGGALPPAVWLLIDAIDLDVRSDELPCNADFWAAVQDELLPLAARHTLFSHERDRTLVAGQSYGGLAALYAGLFMPQRFGRVLTQSGSFWWPDLTVITDGNSSSQPGGWLGEQVRKQGLTDMPLTVFQEAGSREADIEFVNRQMHQALTAAGHRVQFRVYAGGHDALCWRGGLIDGCRWLMAEMTEGHACSHHVEKGNQI
ncbi:MULTISPECIES: enterochelin esterase [Lonsdalea]|uniref:Enterochelin esterase n=2 Tax=Lonsdalea TaxID=1082702 RepID=A0ACD1JHL1_9GAMM|nr:MULTISPECIES: enterochelin esterase [Lonsdalea]OSN02169.1 enterochelin esterase [Lonsdalea populi]QPQ23241.1 enterochelin esterase [Lonsdalea populi]RAT15945.1 enterochelin esterase [Lonsdalea quercina]RAT18760.1 enterochelin esterase [Lonsdalea quercina]RAT23535.1 enterochelin esterase [Lonsdalea populi]